LPAYARAERSGYRGLLGAKLRGSVGAIAAVLGFLLIPWTIGFAFGVLFLEYAHIAVFRNILGGVSAAAAGLLIATGLRMLRPHQNRPEALVIAGLAFSGIAFTNLPLLMVLLSLAALGIVVSGIESSRTR
jgi:chromate transporter